MNSSVGFILGALNHIEDLDLYQRERPFEVWLDKEDASAYPEDQPKTNVKLNLCCNIPISNARDVGIEKFSLDGQGFQFWTHQMPQEFHTAGSLGDGTSVLKPDAVLSYIRIMSDALCQFLRGSKAFCYDWRVRQAKGSVPAAAPRLSSLSKDIDARNVVTDVARQVHADASPDGIKQTIDHVLSPAERESVLRGEYRIRAINLWRPLVPLVHDEALALCDRQTVSNDDWLTLDKVHSHWIEESMYLKHTDEHKWYYLDGQTRDEVTAMVIWDSRVPHSRSASVPHSSVRIPNAIQATPRESIELRFLTLEKEIV